MVLPRNEHGHVESPDSNPWKYSPQVQSDVRGSQRRKLRWGCGYWWHTLRKVWRWWVLENNIFSKYGQFWITWISVSNPERNLIKNNNSAVQIYNIYLTNFINYFSECNNKIFCVHLIPYPTVTPFCSSDQFTCNTPECIPLKYQCNFYDDCKDKSDEVTNYFSKVCIFWKVSCLWSLLRCRKLTFHSIPHYRVFNILIW